MGACREPRLCDGDVGPARGEEDKDDGGGTGIDRGVRASGGGDDSVCGEGKPRSWLGSAADRSPASGGTGRCIILLLWATAELEEGKGGNEIFSGSGNLQVFNRGGDDAGGVGESASSSSPSSSISMSLTTIKLRLRGVLGGEGVVWEADCSASLRPSRNGDGGRLDGMR